MYKFRFRVYLCSLNRLFNSQNEFFMHLSQDNLKIIEEYTHDKVERTDTQHGGCISKSFKIITRKGAHYFAKTALPGMDLSKEANGLKEIAKSATINTPNIIIATPDLLVLEWVDAQRPNNVSFARFGTQLARLHRISNSCFGFHENNYIGSLPQDNTEITYKKNEWCSYFYQYRLWTQVQLAQSKGYADAPLLKSIEYLEKAMPGILADSLEPPSLLHGDLWNGNFIIGPGGEPYLIDPAVYYGHREVDLAMTHLFGGFTQAFYDAYTEHYPLQPGFKKRCCLYQLYYLLVHLNLFGRSYYQQCLDVSQSLL